MSKLPPTPTEKALSYSYDGLDELGKTVIVDLAKDSPALTFRKHEFALTLNYALAAGSDVLSLPGKISYQSGSQQVRGYPTQDGFEMEIVLLSKPATNRFGFTLTGWQDLVFAKQTSAGADFSPRKNAASWTDTEAFDSKGNVIASRADNIPGSIAIYCGKQHGPYGTGKIGHIFRPFAVDALATRVWCDLVYDGAGRLEIVVPQAFLDAAVYPVIVDPTLGYTTVGANRTTDFAATLIGCRASMLEAGTAFRFNLYTDDVTHKYTCGIYNNSAGSPTSLLAKTAGGVFSGGATLEWKAKTIKAALAKGSDYWIAEHCETGGITYYDDPTSIDIAHDFTDAYSDGNLPSPFTSPSINPFGQKTLSMYVDYVQDTGYQLGYHR